MGFSAANLGFVLLLCTGIVLGGVTMEKRADAKEQAPRRPNLTPQEEAEHLVLDAYPDVLTADRSEIDKHAENIVKIREAFSRVSKVLNPGRWNLGEVECSNYSPEIMEKLQSSEYGPVTEESRGDKKVLVFEKPYNPKVLVKKLNQEFGIKSREIWKKHGDFGHIEFDKEENTYTFREGYDNCAPACVDNHFWVFKIESDGTPKLDREYATDIPEPPRNPV